MDNKKKGDELNTKKRGRKPVFFLGVLILFILLGAGALIYRIVKSSADISPENEELSVTEIESSSKGDAVNSEDNASSESSGLGSAVREHIVSALKAVEEAYRKRPPEIELTADNRNTFVDIESCRIDTEVGRISLELKSEGIPKSDDKYYYLFALDSYSDTIGENADYIDRVYKNDEAVLSCALNTGSSIMRLYQKFGVAVKENGRYTLVSIPQFITNPEAVAKHSGVYMTPSTKKGILIDYSKRNSGQLEDLGVGQVALNIRIGDIMGPTTNGLYPTVYYNYNGKTYSFNGAVLSGFDITIRSLTAKGISTTAILLNTYSSSYISLIHPNARSAGACPYYMFNGADAAGVEMLAAVGSFLADRYSSSANGRISNWVIANEINARKEWNYLNYTDVAAYTAEYAKAFRVLYTAIKSTSGSARVYISLDQQWDRNIKNNPDYDGRDVLDNFNSYIEKYGNIDWGLAYHPYNVPLTTCKTWAASKYVSHSAGSSMITMQNIEVLVNYMNQESFKTSDGNVRSIMLTELGYTSQGSGSEQLQAAAIAYAYYKVAHYADIDGLLLNRQTDDATEIAQGLATGITTLSGGHKLSYDVYKYMDTDQREVHTEFAKSIIGISSWSQIIY